MFRCWPQPNEWVRILRQAEHSIVPLPSYQLHCARFTEQQLHHTQLFRSFPLRGAVKPAIDHLPNWDGESSSVSCSNVEAAWCTSEMCSMTGEDGLIEILSLSVFFFLIAQLNTALAALYYHLFWSLYYYSLSNWFWHLEDCWYFKSAKDTESYWDTGKLPQEFSWTNA